MQAWKDDIYRKDQIKANRPFRPAHKTAKPKEIYLSFDTLKTWSNQAVYSLEVMLRVQEQIDQRNIIRFFHDEDGQPGEEMQNVKLVCHMVAFLIVLNSIGSLTYQQIH